MKRYFHNYEGNVGHILITFLEKLTSLTQDMYKRKDNENPDLMVSPMISDGFLISILSTLLGLSVCYFDDLERCEIWQQMKKNKKQSPFREGKTALNWKTACKYLTQSTNQ